MKDVTRIDIFRARLVSLGESFGREGGGVAGASHSGKYRTCNNNRAVCYPTCPSLDGNKFVEANVYSPPPPAMEPMIGSGCRKTRSA